MMNYFRSLKSSPNLKRDIGLVSFGLLFFLAFLTFLSSLLIRGNVLTTGYYIDALDDARAFDRVYEELLADPEFADAVEPFFGEFGLNQSYTVSALRFAAPPDQLRSWSEDALDRVTAYIRGDTPRYSGELDFTKIVENQRSSLISYVTRQLVAADIETAGSQPEFEARLDEFLAELGQGQISGSIPSFTLNQEAARKVSAAILGSLNTQTADAIKSQVETYLSLNDIVGALTVALPVLLEEEIADANSRMLSWLGGDATVDPVARISDVLQNEGSQVVTHLDSMRDRANRISPIWLPGLSVFVMSLAVIGIMALITGFKARFTALGILLAASGFIIWAMSAATGESLLTAIAGNPLEPGLLDRPEGWGLPQSARHFIADINSALFGSLAHKSEIAGLVLMFVGLGVLTAVLVASHFHPVRKGRYNWLVTRQTAAIGGVFSIAAVVVPLLLLNAPRFEPEMECNGHGALCDLRYDEVTYAATHNSMSSSVDGWLLPAQDVSLRQQLDDGIRALLIDTHYWQTPAESVAAIESNSSFSPELAAFLRNLLSNLGTAPEGTYLCHATCWLGAKPFSDSLIQIRDFLDDNPNEVVTLIIQDAITVADTEAAFQTAGLNDMLFELEPGEEWPTLREMVESGRRLVVLAEVGSPPPGWYMNAWDLLQETPFDSKSIDALSCDENRGSRENSLFLMNHWINRTPPDRVDAAKMNSFDQIVGRAARCEAERGLKPNYIAVNFHRLGDVLAAVDYINAVTGR